MTIDERLEALTMHLELLSHSHESLTDSHKALAKSHAKTEDTLRRAIAASVKEARQERLKRRAADAKLDEKLASLATSMKEGFKELRSAQAVTERLFQAWLKRSSNGKH